MKRTTLLIESALYVQLRRRAAAEGRTLTEIVAGALRRGLAEPPPGRRRRATLPSYDLGPFLVSPAGEETPGIEAPEPSA